MATKIEWVRNPDGTKGETWNPVTGCTKISAGCANCYAERMARRLAGRCGYPEAPNHFDVTLHPDKLEQPLHWRKPRRVFVVSMGDLFHEDVPPWFICEVWQIMRECPRHTFQILTKRPERMYKVITTYIASDALSFEPLPNVWLGVTAENQKQADARIPILLQIPAALRFVSVEPMLERIFLIDYLPSAYHAAYDRPVLDWIICGGESGPGARPMYSDWARSLRDQCQEAGVPYFFKSWGAWMPEDQEGCPFVDPLEEHIKELRGLRTANFLSFPDGKIVVRTGKKAAGRLLDGREWNEYPEAAL